MDTLAAIVIMISTCATMFPLSVYSAKVLLQVLACVNCNSYKSCYFNFNEIWLIYYIFEIQTTPAHIVGQLDKSLRETLTIDGVLEFRNEHFWTLAFGKMVRLTFY